MTTAGILVDQGAASGFPWWQRKSTSGLSRQRTVFLAEHSFLAALSSVPCDACVPHILTYSLPDNCCRPHSPKECQRQVEPPELLMTACSRHCKNGHCTPTGKCCCSPGWEGPFCRVGECLSLDFCLPCHLVRHLYVSYVFLPFPTSQHVSELQPITVNSYILIYLSLTYTYININREREIFDLFCCWPVLLVLPVIVAKCEPACRNGGVCMEPSKCLCKSGYSGAQCEKSEGGMPNDQEKDGILDHIIDMTTYLLDLTSYIV